MEKLKNRLEIMKSANLLTQENENLILKMIDMFNTKYNIKLSEENGSMLITHIVMYLKRIGDNEIVEPLDKDSIDEILASDKYKLANEILSDIEKQIFLFINSNEKSYILLHLINLLEHEEVKSWELLLVDKLTRKMLQKY